MAFTLSLIDKAPSGITHIAARGEATHTDFPAAVQSPFDQLLGGKWASHLILLDMDEVPYIDSSAIGFFIGASKYFRAGGGMLVLHSVQPAVKGILTLLKINRIIPVADNADAARQLLLQSKETPCPPP